jgi:hypothetical protein
MPVARKSPENSLVRAGLHGSADFCSKRSPLQARGHRGRQLIGAPIGAGVGLGKGASIDSNCSATAIVCAENKGKAIGTPLFALLGAGIGVLPPAGGWQELYRAR